MALLFSSDFTTSDGWTVTQTNGTVTFNTSIGGKTAAHHTKDANSWGTNGISTTTPIAGVAGQVVYYSMRSDSTSLDCFGGCWTDQLALLTAFTGRFGVYLNGDFDIWNGGAAVTDGPAFSTDTWYNLRWTINEDGSVTVDYHADNGTPIYAVEDWTEIGTCGVVGVNVPDHTTETELYFHTNLNTLGVNVYIADFYWTDNGSVTAFSPMRGRRGATLVAQGQM